MNVQRLPDFDLKVGNTSVEWHVVGWPFEVLVDKIQICSVVEVRERAVEEEMDPWCLAVVSCQVGRGTLEDVRSLSSSDLVDVGSSRYMGPGIWGHLFQHSSWQSSRVDAQLLRGALMMQDQDLVCSLCLAPAIVAEEPEVPEEPAELAAPVEHRLESPEEEPADNAQ